MKRSPLPVLFAPTHPHPGKPLMVLLPGLDGTGKLFAPQVETLSRHFDLRCLSIPEDNRQGWEELATTIVNLIHHEHEQQARAIYLCGESFGGCLALQVALTAPALLNRLVLINPASSLRLQIWSRWMPQAAAYIPEWLYNTSGTLAFPLLADFERICTYWQRTFIDTVRPISRDCVIWRLRMLQSFEVSASRLQRLTMPTALIASGRDRLLPSCQEVERLKQLLPDAVTHCFPDSGHVCLLEQAISLAQCLGSLDFLPRSSSIKV